MGDGWETKRSRQQGHKDWVIIKLFVPVHNPRGLQLTRVDSGAPGLVDHFEVDTAHFMGNFPESVELEGLHDLDTDVPSLEAQWVQLVQRTKTGPHRRHFFHVDYDRPVSHVKMTIHPDGGVKRVRVIGWKDGQGDKAKAPTAEEKEALAPSKTVPSTPTSCTSGNKVITLHALPLTPEAFASFGHVVQAYADPNGAPRGTRITPANAGTATKFHKLAPVVSSYPIDKSASAGIAVYRCQPAALAADQTLKIDVMERHPYTNQAFLPMGQAYQGLQGEGAIANPAQRYLVVVAKGGDEGPDMKTARAFLASAAQGVVYDTAVWRKSYSITKPSIYINFYHADQPMTVLDHHMDLACVETQIGDGDKADCEIVEIDKREGIFRVQL
jgi:allantoicase